MVFSAQKELSFCVAPLAGSVDRNTNTAKKTKTVNGRSPRGERG